MSMAAGEYVSVHSQKDTEDADLALERAELRTNEKGEHEELTEIYVDRGLDRTLARKVADQLMTHNALGAHARDELGITPTLEARPIQAALASAGSFVLGAAMPLIVAASGRPRSRKRVSFTPSRRRHSSSWRLWARWPRGWAAREWRPARCGSRSGARWRWASRRAPAPCSARLFEITRDDARRRNRSPAASRLRGNSSFRLSATRTRDRERGLIRKHLIEELGKPMRFGSPRHRKAPE
jgi:hypothetical protein